MRDLAVKTVPANWGALWSFFKPTQFRLPVSSEVVAVKQAMKDLQVMYTFDPEATSNDTWEVVFVFFSSDGTYSSDIGEGWKPVPTFESSNGLALVRRKP